MYIPCHCHLSQQFLSKSARCHMLGTQCWARNVGPKEYVAAQPRLRKKTQKLRGTAGPKRARLIAERRRESEKTESKFQFLEMEGCGAAGGSSTKSKSIPAVIPDVIFPSSESDDDFMEVRVALPRLELSF
jgi:hypothetical protein